MKRRFTTLLLALMGLTATAWADDEHAYVDLGLPSGTLWATTNVGASEGNVTGDLYQWGETTTPTIYFNTGSTTFDSYVLNNGVGQMTKYNAVDNLTKLETTDDAATQQWGADWRIPSTAQWEELINPAYTTMEWGMADDNWHSGFRITSKANGNSVFIPAAGCGKDFGLEDSDYACYWTRNLASNDVLQAYYAQLGAYSQDINQGNRYFGCSIRPVINGTIPIDEAHFPDAKFRASLLAQSYGADGILTEEEIAEITRINVRWDDVTDLTGIAYFTALTDLSADGISNPIDLSGNTALQSLYLVNSNISTLDLSKNTALQSLYLESCKLTSLDLSNNTELAELLILDCGLTTLDLSANTHLAVLALAQNQLKSIDLSANTSLEQLSIGEPFSEWGKEKFINTIRDVSSATPTYTSEDIETPMFAIAVYTAEGSDVLSFRKSQVRRLTAKGWPVYDAESSVYEGVGYSAYDANGDGEFTLADVTFLVDMLLEMQSEE